MRTKELIAEMQKEIKELKDETKALKKQTSKLKDVAYWLEYHDRDDVEIKNLGCLGSTIYYFYDGEIKIATSLFRLKLIKNTDEAIIVESEKTNKYFQIDKATATVTEIPKPELVVDSVNLEKRIDCIADNINLLWDAYYKSNNKIDSIIEQQKSQEKQLDEIERFSDGIGEVVEFTNLYGADSIIFQNWHDGTEVKYLYNNAKHCVRYNFDYGTDKLPICVKNGDIAILECSGKYYQLDKGKGTIIEIPKPAFVVEKKKSSKKAKK